MANDRNKEEIKKILPNKNIGRNIAHYRKERNLSQAKLATIVGMDDNHISCIEIGLKYPSVNTIARIAVGLGVSIDVLNQHMDPNV